MECNRRLSIVDVMDDAKKKIAEVFSRAAETYDRVGPRFFSYFGRRLVDLAVVELGAKVLDAASGSGAILFPAAQQVGPEGRVVGIDISQAMIERLREKITSRGMRNAAACLMDAEELACQNARFDFVLCGFALDSFSDPDRAILEFHRVLRRRGRLGLTISSGWWWERDDRWHWHGELLRSLEVKIDAGERRFATAKEVEHDLEAAGFARISVLKEEFALVFADAETWWGWTWSHGYRRVLESMRPETLEQYRAACFEQLTEQARAGSIQGKLYVFLVLATRP